MDRIRVGILVFPQVQQLDLTGPFEVLSRLGTPPSLSAPSKFAQSRTHVVAKTMLPVSSDRGLGIGGDDRAPAIARGKRGDKPALRRFIIDQHQQALFAFRHCRFQGPQGSAGGITRLGKDGIKADPGWPRPVRNGSYPGYSRHSRLSGGICADRGGANCNFTSIQG